MEEAIHSNPVIEEENELINEEEEELLQQMCNLWVDDGRVKVSDGGRDLDKIKWDLCLVGKELTEKFVSFHGLNTYLQNKWKPKHNMEMYRRDGNLFIF